MRNLFRLDEYFARSMCHRGGGPTNASPVSRSGRARGARTSNAASRCTGTPARVWPLAFYSAWVAVLTAGSLPQAAGAASAPLQSVLSPAGIQATRIAHLWNLTLIVCSGVFAAVLLVLLVAIVRNRRSDHRTTPDLSSLAQPEGNTRRMVVAATLLSSVLLFGLLFADVLTDHALSTLPVANALTIEVTGHQWWWEARYPSGRNGDADHFTVANELHIPVGRPVIVRLRTTDVIHTFWVPNLHGKRDMIPGRDATIEFRADKAGTYRGQCAEFCGFEHALMAFYVVAESPAAYDAWAAHQRGAATLSAGALLQRGQQVFTSGTCASCHTVRGTSATGTLGPDLTHLMSRQTIAAGTLPNTTGNLAGWIVDAPRLKPGTTMPPNRLAPADLQALLAWLGTLR
ncbi:Cytochrome c oxidase subunit 2 [Pararobbsia alpina]|uniref:cytochrome-c oxidase n=2 Tax=Pararobbsia alpina TaxID=621374 RepID=A0A6S7BMB9_9BURK|nr:Cytochrome c oxidase subunit 2 [Pararobbsia alpina]